MSCLTSRAGVVRRMHLLNQQSLGGPMYGSQRVTALLALLSASPVEGRFSYDRRTGSLHNRSVAHNDHDLSASHVEEIPQFALLQEAPPSQSWLTFHASEADAMAHAGRLDSRWWSAELLFDLDAGEAYALAQRTVRSGMAFAMAEAPDAD